MSFPNNLPEYVTPDPNKTLDQDNHTQRHADEEADITELARKVGVNNSTDPNSIDNKLGSLDSRLTSHVTNTSDPHSTLAQVYPVGSVYINAEVSTNPFQLFGFGTWVAFGSGRVPVGVDATQSEFNTPGKTGGAKTHTLTVAEMPSHNHDHYEWLHNGVSDSGGVRYGFGYQRDTGTLIKTTSYNTSSAVPYGNGPTGGDGAHNNLQPYITVYMWKRTA